MTISITNPLSLRNASLKEELAIIQTICNRVPEAEELLALESFCKNKDSVSLIARCLAERGTEDPSTYWSLLKKVGDEDWQACLALAQALYYCALRSAATMSIQELALLFELNLLPKQQQFELAKIIERRLSIKLMHYPTPAQG